MASHRKPTNSLWVEHNFSSYSRQKLSNAIALLKLIWSFENNIKSYIISCAPQSISRLPPPQTTNEGKSRTIKIKSIHIAKMGFIMCSILRVNSLVKAARHPKCHFELNGFDAATKTPKFSVQLCRETTFSGGKMFWIALYDCRFHDSMANGLLCLFV